MTPEERIAYEKKLNQATANISLGTINTGMICPHCQTKGSVRIKQIKRKKGISGAKATGALFTGGLSILATGLSRKEAETQAHCEKCNSTWYF